MPKGKKIGGRDWKPGQSGNPAGRPKLPDDVKKARALTTAEFVMVVNQYIHMTKYELEAIEKDPMTANLDLMVISMITKAIRDGDRARFDGLLDRLVGKVADKLNATHVHALAQIEEIEAMSREDKITLFKQKLKEIEEGNGSNFD